MDILNNIWIAISTPNEKLIDVFLVFATFIESYLILAIINTVFGLNYDKRQKICFIIIYSIISSITLIIPAPFNTIVNYVSLFIIIHFMFKPAFVKSLVMTFLPSIIFALMQSLILNPYLSIFNITYEQISTIPMYRIPFLLIGYFIVFLINIIFKYRNFKLNIFDNLDKKNKSIIILNFIFGFLTILIQAILTISYIDILSITFSFFNFICLLIYFALSIYSLTKVMNLAATTQKLESAEEYNKTLHILHDSVRGFKHDFDNIVTTIGGYIKTNDMNGLEKYYSQLQEDCAKVNNLYILNPDIINNPGIYNLLTTKYNEADEKGIKVNLTFLLDLNNINMKIYEFARILGILLDNAIEAASECDDKIINITFRNDSKNNRNLVIIENTYKDKNVDINNIFNKGISGKENHTGLGLWEVRQILNKNNNVNLHTDKNQEYFIQQLEIYY